MSDWLNSDDNDGYLGLDDPAMPDAAPAPPSAPAAVATPDAGGDDAWLSGGNDDWLGGSADPAPTPSQSTGGQVMDSGGDWMSGGHEAPAQQPAVVPGAAPVQQQHYEQQPAPMAMAYGGDISVTPPQLAQVQPSPRNMGGAASRAGSELNDLVLDVEVQVEVGLGNAALTVEEFLEMGRGSVVELDTPIDAPIDLRVRGKLIARGQLVSINGSYGMRIIEMLNEEN